MRYMLTGQTEGQRFAERPDLGLIRHEFLRQLSEFC